MIARGQAVAPSVANMNAGSTKRSCILKEEELKRLRGRLMGPIWMRQVRVSHLRVSAKPRKVSPMRRGLAFLASYVSPVSDLRNASVLITGASGFIGTRLVRHLAGRTQRLVAMARGTATTLHPELRDVETVLGDVSVPSQMCKALRNVDVVIHLAGHSGAGESANDPHYDLNSNVAGIITLLEAARAQSNKIRIVFPGSRLQYGRVKALPVAETDALRPVSPYGVNKYACELYLDMYARVYGISYAVARLTNPYGPWAANPAREYNVLNKLIATAAAGGSITVYGDGKQLRDYVYVDDVVRAIELLAAFDENIVANVGSGSAVSFRHAAETIVRIAGRGSIVSVPWPENAQRVETGDFVADISRMRSLGWTPATPLDEGVKMTLEHVAGIA